MMIYRSRRPTIFFPRRSSPIELKARRVQRRWHSSISRRRRTMTLVTTRPSSPRLVRLHDGRRLRPRTPPPRRIRVPPTHRYRRYLRPCARSVSRSLSTVRLISAVPTTAAADETTTTTTRAVDVGVFHSPTTVLITQRLYMYVRRSLAARFTICIYTAASGAVKSIMTTYRRSSDSVCVLNADKNSSISSNKMATMAASTTMWRLRTGTDCLRMIARRSGNCSNCRTYVSAVSMPAFGPVKGGRQRCRQRRI